MIQETVSTRKMTLKGTIIDFETTGDLDFKHNSPDPRYFGDISPTIFGYLTNDKMVQYCAEGVRDQEKLIGTISETLLMLDEPFFALNTSFERHILTTYCDLNPVFIDVRGKRWAGKKWFRDYLGLPHYDDPFDCQGVQCKIEWDKGNYNPCLLHNQACLQLERDILEILKFEPERLPF